MICHRQLAQVLSATTAVWTMVTAPGLAVDTISTQGAPIDDLQRDIQFAVCLNEWDRAIDLTGALIASPQISPEQRAEIVTARHQLQAALQRRDPINVAAFNCEQRLAQYVQVHPTDIASLDWDRAFYSASGATEFNPLPDQQARQQAAAQRAGLNHIVDTDIPALSPATLVATDTGTGVSAGFVSTDVDVFSFIGAGGDQITLNITVTDVLPGRLYNDDDSQLFLFDSEGALVAENDDLSRLQSQLEGVTLPQTGVYYVAVTTYNNDPILDSAQRVTDWTGNGGSAIEYTITVTGLTPATELALP